MAINHRQRLLDAIEAADPRRMADPDQDGGKDAIYAAIAQIPVDADDDLLQAAAYLNYDLDDPDPTVPEVDAYRVALRDAVKAIA